MHLCTTNILDKAMLIKMFSQRTKKTISPSINCVFDWRTISVYQLYQVIKHLEICIFVFKEMLKRFSLPLYV